MAEPFSFFGNTTLDNPKEDYTNALLGKKPKENAFANPQVNPMMAQTQILGQAPVAQAAMPVAQPQVAQPQVVQPPVAPAPVDDRIEAFNLFDYLKDKLPDEASNQRARNSSSYSPFGGISVPNEPAGTGEPSPIIEGIKTAFTPAWEQEQQAQQAQQELAAGTTVNPFLAPGQTEAVNPFTEPYADGSVPTSLEERLLDPTSDDSILARRAAREQAAQIDNSPQANFLREKERLGGQPMTNDQIAQATRLAASMGTTFDPETGYSRDAFLAGEPAPRPNNLTTLGGTPLNEFLSGAAIPDQGFASAENAMYGDESLSRGLGGDAAMKAFQDASEAREARLGFDNRPGVDVPSLAMQRSRMDAGLDPVEGAPTGTDMSQQQQRDALERGFDPATGQPIQGGDGMTDKDLADIAKTRAETLEILSKIGDGTGGAELDLTPIEKSRDTEAGKELAKWESGGRATIQSNVNSLNKVIESLDDGQIKTRGFIDALPFGADWARAIFNPNAQDAKDRVQGVIFQTLRETLGAQFTEREGQRLVEASYNTKLSPAQNAARLKDYVRNLSAAAEARDAQTKYMSENRTLVGYQGPDPEALMLRGVGGSGGSPIQGDVDYASSTQSKASDVLNAQ